MALIGGMIGAGLLSGLGQGLMGALHENRLNDQDLRLDKFRNRQLDVQSKYYDNLLNQNHRGQNLNLFGGLANTGIGAVGGLIQSGLNYKTQQDNLDFMKQTQAQRRSDLLKDGLPLSYLHLGGSSALQSPPMQREQTTARSTSTNNRFANSGGLTYSQLHGAPPPYQETDRSNEFDRAHNAVQAAWEL